MQIVEGNRALLVKTADPANITGVIPKSHVLTKDSTGAEVAVNWGHGEASALADLGYMDTPSPILKNYTWTGRYTPFDHQKTTASFLSIRKRAFCFNEQGTGKTASVIWAADYLLNRNEIKRVLVLCPLSIMKSAWQKDMFTFAMHRSCDVAHGTPKQRKKVLAAPTQFVIINFDGVGVVEDEIIAGGFDLIVVDEASAYKNSQTNRWKVLNRILNATQARLWMLTGTPAAQSPLDAYGLAKLVNPNGVPRYYGAFRDKVMYKLTQFKWMPKPQAESVVHQVLQPALPHP